MEEFNTKKVQVETATALEAVKGAGAEKLYALYAGLDVHKETIAVAVARPGRDEPEYRGEIAHTRKRWPS